MKYEWQQTPPAGVKKETPNADRKGNMANPIWVSYEK
jgi:hypothetical protein